MAKPVLIGAGLGVLLLAAAAGALWLTGRGPGGSAPAPYQAVLPRAATPPVSVASAPIKPQHPAEPGSSPAQTQERRQRVAQVRAELNALRAQGAQASPVKMRALVDELQALSPAGMDPRYFQALRNMLDASIKVQALSDELKGPAANDPARQQAIMAQLQTLGEQVQVEARNMQAYAQPTGVEKQP